MEKNEEYHDPDYANTSGNLTEEQKTVSETNRIELIRNIVRREFKDEIEIREKEIADIDQRLQSARHLLHRLRYTIVQRYYNDQKLQLTPGQIQENISAQHEPRSKAQVSSLLIDGQRRIHPSLRKLLGKQSVDIEEIFRSRSTRNKIRKDYSAMAKPKNYTIPADSTKTLRPDIKSETVELKRSSTEEPSSSKAKKPKLLPKLTTDVVTVDEASRNKQKHRYRIIIGNTSKYFPPASRLDRCTHKWLLYVRSNTDAGLSKILTAVTVNLHHSYAPHHIVHIDKEPYHIARRGWGEFPAMVELHFSLPELNRPATVEHTIKLDRNYTGVQTLGAETLVDVWLYSNEEMLPYEFKEDDTQTETPNEQHVEEKAEDTIETNKQINNWLDFFNNDTTELDVDELLLKNVKKEIKQECTENTLNNTHVTNNIELDEVNIKQEIEYDDATNDMEVDNQDVCQDFDTNVVVEKLENQNENINGALNDSIPSELLKHSPKKRIMKYMDPATRKIYYLELDRSLDLSKVQEIVINSKGNIKTAKLSPTKSNGMKMTKKIIKKGDSILKTDLRSLLKTENLPMKIESTNITNPNHILHDHCYLGVNWSNKIRFPVLPASQRILPNCDSVARVKEELVENGCLYDRLCENILRFSCIRAAVSYLLKRIPLVCENVRDVEFYKNMPFVVFNKELFWNMDFAKRRNIEWSRAKLINTILNKYFTSGPIWRTKQILLFSRLHGYYPVRDEKTELLSESETWSSWNDTNSRKVESSIKEIYPNPSDVTTLSKFDPSNYVTEVSNSTNPTELVDLTETGEIDVVGDSPVKVKKEVLPVENCGSKVLPVENEDDRLRFLYIEKQCADIGIELRNEDVGNGYTYSATHAVILSAVKSFAEELLRSSLAASLSSGQSGSDPPLPVWTSDSSRRTVKLRDVWLAMSNSRAAILSGRGLGSDPVDTCPL